MRIGLSQTTPDENWVDERKQDEEFFNPVNIEARAQKYQRQFFMGLVFDAVTYAVVFGGGSWGLYRALKKQEQKLSPAWKQNMLPISLGGAR